MSIYCEVAQEKKLVLELEFMLTEVSLPLVADHCKCAAQLMFLVSKCGPSEHLIE